MHFLGLLALASAAITSFQQEFSGKLANYKHLKVDNKNFDDEVVLAWTTKGEFWVSHNQGESWKRNKLGNIVRVIAHPFANERAFVFTNSKVYSTDDHARTFSAMRLPAQAAITGHVFEFNEKDPDYIIFHSKEQDCNDQVEECAKTAWHTRDGGRSWKKMIDHVATCRFVVDLIKDTGRDLVFCQHYRGEDTTNSELVISNDYFKTSEVKFERIVGFALDAPFLVVASYSEDEDSDALLAYVTTDGHTFSPAHLPDDIIINNKMGYTVIDSSTKTLFLDITSAHEYGDIYKSNANGIDFTRILTSVNRNSNGFVDFEKISIEGVALANVVDNADDLMPGDTKVLKSLISHSDGAYWDPIPAPDGECFSDDDYECSLHLHGYTERYDPRNTPDSKAAVGMIIATGNIGESLLPIKDGNTYISSDAGISWRRIAEEPKLWEYGDSGAILVTARYGDVTNTIEYSTDEGQTWQDYQFSDEMVQVLNIANIPSDTSRKFVIFARGPLNKGDKTLAITIQFNTPRQCKIDDFYDWTPSHPRLGDDECLFGHKVFYMRKGAEVECSIGKRPPVGKEPLGTPSSRLENCKCSIRDYECDYNHERADDGKTCQLMEGKTVPDKDAQCANGGISWREITGYRKISIDTCVGGEELGPKQFFPCPGKEKEFEEMFGSNPDNGNSGSGSGGGGVAGIVFFVIIVVIGAVAFFTLTKQGRSRISLDEDPDSFSNGGSGALGAVVGLGMLIVSQFKELSDRLLGSVEERFASRRGVYARLDDDERARILSEHLSDDELDNQELDNFNLYEDE